MKSLPPRAGERMRSKQVRASTLDGFIACGCFFKLLLIHHYIYSKIKGVRSIFSKWCHIPTIVCISMVMLIVAKDREKNPVYCGPSYLDMHIRFQSVTNIHNMLTIILLVHTCCILAYAVLQCILAWVDREFQSYWHKVHINRVCINHWCKLMIVHVNQYITRYVKYIRWLHATRWASLCANHTCCRNSVV